MGDVVGIPSADQRPSLVEVESTVPERADLDDSVSATDAACLQPAQLDVRAPRIGSRCVLEAFWTIVVFAELLERLLADPAAVVKHLLAGRCAVAARAGHAPCAELRGAAAVRASLTPGARLRRAAALSRGRSRTTGPSTGIGNAAGRIAGTHACAPLAWLVQNHA